MNGETAEITKKNTLLAALFLANRAMTLEELSQAANCPVEEVEGLVAELRDDLKAQNLPLKLSLTEEAGKLAGSHVKLEVEEAYLPAVAHLSKQVELGRKAQRILALVAKKKELLQSELKYYFKGDVYEAVEELVRQKYLSWEKHKTTKKLKPTALFFERFRMLE